MGKIGRPKKTPNTKLTRLQEKFVKIFVSSDGMKTKRECAIESGFNPKTAHVKAYQLTDPNKNPHVCKAIKEYQAELDEKYGVTYQRHLRDLQKIRDLAVENGQYSSAVQAEYRRGQAQGNIYVNKSEIRVGSIDQMSKEEVLKALEELKSTYGNNIIDITPKEKNIKRNKILQTSKKTK